jgi:two-component system, sensor histidine kinase and response regulator
MQAIASDISGVTATKQRAAVLVEEHQRALNQRTDRLFVVLMLLQWLAAIGAALWISPRTWAGSFSETHPHVWAALLLGGLVTLFPVGLALVRPGSVLTRHTIAIGQMLMSALLIHLTGGRIETHFHVFGSLAILAFYRDWRVLISASAVVAADHYLRGAFWPQSVYGTFVDSSWRWLEHAGWVVFEDVFLTILILQNNSAAERQAQLEITNEVIENAVAERTAELEASKAAAESANRTKSEFLASMSHELRTPLNAVIGFSELLSEQVFGPLNERQKDYADSILVSGRHLLKLINDILDLAKVEAGHMELDLAEVPVEQALRNAETIVRPLADKKLIHLEVSAEECPRLVADPGKLNQILFNLLSNAVKFTPEGGRVAMSAAPARTSPDAEPDAVQISITDTGIGIGADHLERIFSEFVQVDSSLSRRHAGTGLGLALTKKLVELHGGQIRVESEGEGTGSTFIVVLPIKAASEITLPAFSGSDVRTPARSMVPEGEERLVLVVEDDRPTSELLRQYLIASGYSVIQAYSGDEAVKVAREQSPHAIILDIVLPHPNGWQVLANLKSDPQTQGIPTVVVSVTEDREIGLALGAAEWLVKPVDRRRLLNALRRVAPASGNNQGSILVVDDEPETVRWVSDLLRSQGYEVLQAHGGREAIKMALEKLPDGIVLDLMMPDVTGFDVIAVLRNHPQAGRIPVVVFTAKDLTEADRWRINGATGAVLAKSSFDDLLNELGRAMAPLN